MNANLSSRMVRTGLFWGAIWGLYEATVGYLVHSYVRMPGTSSLLLVPFAVLCMTHATAASGHVRSAGVAAVTAAAIKLINLALPIPYLHAVLNPALAIVFEGLAFMAVAWWVGLPERRPTLAVTAAGALVFNLAWRVLFLSWSAILAAGWSTGLLTQGVQAPLGFLGRDGVLSSLAIVGVLALVYRGGRTPRTARLVPGAAGVTGILVLAVAAEVAVGLLG